MYDAQNGNENTIYRDDPSEFSKIRCVSIHFCDWILYIIAESPPILRKSHPSSRSFFLHFKLQLSTACGANE